MIAGQQDSVYFGGNAGGLPTGNSLKAVFRIVMPLFELAAKKSARMIPRFLVLVLIVFFASITLADDFKTIDGKEYKDATVSRVEPDGLVLITKFGISKVYFVELPKEVQERFHYDAAKAAQFTTVQQSAIAQSNATVAAQQQQEAQERQRQAAAIAQQRQQAQEQQRQADAIAMQQEAQRAQQQLEAQQKQGAKIAAQKQARQQQQRKPRTTGGSGDRGYSSESYTRYNPGGGYESLQRSGNARMGSYHHETHGPRSPNAAWTDNVTDASWGPR
jgi:hypothetical protein